MKPYFNNLSGFIVLFFNSFSIILIKTSLHMNSNCNLSLRYITIFLIKEQLKISYINCSFNKFEIILSLQKYYIKFNPTSYGNGIDKSFGSFVKIILFEYATMKPNSNIVPFPILPSGLHTIIASAFLNLFI